MGEPESFETPTWNLFGMLIWALWAGNGGNTHSMQIVLVIVLFVTCFWMSVVSQHHTL